MNQDSSTYNFLSPLPSSEEQIAVASVIVDMQGDCTSLNLCLKCPFVDACFRNISSEHQFLDKSIRLRKAEEFLFTKLIEDELED